jgi:hypothetical protein
VGFGVGEYSESLLLFHKVYYLWLAIFLMSAVGFTWGLLSLSFEDWLYRKSEQNAHSEILAFLMMVLGVNILVGGLVVTVMMVGQAPLFPFMSSQPVNGSAAVGLVLTLVGFCLLCAGFLLVVHYDRERSWYLGEIEKSTKIRNRKVTVRAAHDILEELVENRKKN